MYVGLEFNKSHTDAYRYYYKSVIDHSFPGEENTTSPAFVALSRYHKTGLVGVGDGGVVVEQSKELADTYLAFSESNPESA